MYEFLFGPTFEYIYNYVFNRLTRCFLLAKTCIYRKTDGRNCFSINTNLMGTTNNAYIYADSPERLFMLEQTNCKKQLVQSNEKNLFALFTMNFFANGINERNRMAFEWNCYIWSWYTGVIANVNKISL